MSRPIVFDTGSGVRAACAAVAKRVGAENEPSRALVAHLRLVVRVGSLMETDDETGAAHFIEHLGFRGTRNFDHGELIKTIESFGSSFGPDLNARTSLCETVWQLDIPMTCLAQGLCVLREWAFHIRIAQEDVEAERKVILEEWRTKQTAGQRIKKRFWQLAAPLVSERMPIGSKAFIESVNREHLRKFYETYYTPDNMALICVLEGPSAGLEATCEEARRHIEAAFAHAESRPSLYVPRRAPESLSLLRFGAAEKRHFACVIDPDLAATSVSLEFLSDQFRPSASVAFFKRDITRRVLVSVLDERFRERRFSGLVHRSASVSCGLAMHRPFVEMSGIRMELPSQCSAKECCEMLSIISAEIALCLKEGFSANEIEHAKNKWRRHFSDVKPSSHVLCEELVMYFCLDENIPLLGHEDERTKALTLLEPCITRDRREGKRLHVSFDDSLSPISPEDVHVLCKEWESCMKSGESEHVFLCLFQGTSLPEGLDEASMRRAVKMGMDSYQSMLGSALSEANRALYDETLLKESVRNEVGRLVDPAKLQQVAEDMVVEEMNLPSVEARLLTFRYQNEAVTMCFRNKRTQEDDGKNQVSFQAFALGGATELALAEEDCGFCLMGDALRESGLGPLSATELARLESLTGARVYLQRHLHHRGIGGSAPSASMQMLLDMLLVRVYSVRCDSQVLERLKMREKDNINAQLLGSTGDETQALREAAFGTIEPLLRPHHISDVDKLDTDMVVSVVRRAFQPLSNFSFCFVGKSVNMDIIRDFAARLLYLSIANEHQGQGWSRGSGLTRPMNLQFTPLPKPEIVYTGKTHTDKSQVYVVLRPSDCESPVEAFRRDFILGLTCEAIRSRLLLHMRTNGGHVYSVNTDVSRVSMSAQVRCFISFSCDTMKDEILTETCMKVLGEAAATGFTEEEITNVMKMAQNKLERNGTSDSTWLFKTLDALKAADQTRVSSTAKVGEIIETIVSQKAHKELLGLLPSSNNTANAVSTCGEELRRTCQDMLANGERMLIVRYRPLKL